MEWISCTTPGNNFSNYPPCEDGEYDGYNNSIEVIFTDGTDVYVGHLTLELDDDFIGGHYSTWSTGRSGWNIDDVTHWAFLPKLP